MSAVSNEMRGAGVLSGALAKSMDLWSAFGRLDDYSYDGVMRAVDQSFQRLGIERIDVLHIHDVDIW